ncbi:MAG: DEAD/DEAH box helicase, partial [Myxococcota bacterium]
MAAPPAVGRNRALAEFVCAVESEAVFCNALVHREQLPAQAARCATTRPQVLITTPDMLHAGILPHRGLWKEFFAHLSLVVVDELHIYRGVFGAHVAQVM